MTLLSSYVLLGFAFARLFERNHLLLYESCTRCRLLSRQGQNLCLNLLLFLAIGDVLYTFCKAITRMSPYMRKKISTHMFMSLVKGTIVNIVLGVGTTRLLPSVILQVAIKR